MSNEEKRDIDFVKENNTELSGRYVARMAKNSEGMYKDEVKTLDDGTKILVVFPYTVNRASKHNFREMTLEEIKNYFEIVRKYGKKTPYEVLERELAELKKKFSEKK